MSANELSMRVNGYEGRNGSRMRNRFNGAIGGRVRATQPSDELERQSE